MTIGDSVMYDGEVGIGRHCRPPGCVAVSPHGFPGWGLSTTRTSRPSLAGAVAEDHPEVILMMWSWDNADARDHPGAYRRLLTEAARRDAGPG